MKVLYLDCFGGISGDMVAGALIDAGMPVETLQARLQLLGVSGYTLKISQERIHGWRGTRFNVQVEEQEQPRRTFQDIEQLIHSSNLPTPVKDIATAIFQKLAEAEGRVHGIAPEDVHFHEAGAVDSIVDIVSTAISLHELKIEKVYCSPLPVSYGQVRCQHGVIPLPAPATAELLKGLPVRSVDVEGELVTPTGAAIASALATEFGTMPSMTINSVGYGLGSRSYGIPNFLRIFWGEIQKNTFPEGTWEDVLLLETNIDDMNPEILAFTTEQLLKEGALDVFLTPVIMKKGRQGSLLTVLCQPEKMTPLLRTVFRQTTSLGIRLRTERRLILPREEVEIKTIYGTARAKVAIQKNEIIQISPEYEDCRKLAVQRDVPLKAVYQEVLKEAEKEKPSWSGGGR